MSDFEDGYKDGYREARKDQREIIKALEADVIVLWALTPLATKNEIEAYGLCPMIREIAKAKRLE